MDPTEKQEISEALDEVHDLLAGDAVTLVKATGAEHDLVGMMEDIDPATDQGLLVDHAGIRDQRIRRLTLLKRDLDAAGTAVEASDHFLIGNERWDLVVDEVIKDHTVPIAGIHNQVEVILRRAVELNKSAPATEFTYGD